MHINRKGRTRPLSKEGLWHWKVAKFGTVEEVMTKENLVTAPVGTSLAEAKAILRQHRIEIHAVELHLSTQAGAQSAQAVRVAAQELGCRSLHVVKANVFLYLKSCAKQFDLIFSDAPYDLPGSEEVIRLVFERELLRDDGMLVFEHSRQMDFREHEHFWQQRSYGSVQFTFFKK